MSICGVPEMPVTLPFSVPLPPTPAIDRFTSKVRSSAPLCAWPTKLTAPMFLAASAGAPVSSAIGPRSLALMSKVELIFGMPWPMPLAVPLAAAWKPMPAIAALTS